MPCQRHFLFLHPCFPIAWSCGRGRQGNLESLKQQNKDLFEVLQTGDFERLIVAIDLRGQFGGQASLWEVVTSTGSLFTTVPCGISGLSLAAFICGLCYKGAVPVVLVGDTLDVGIRRMMDLFSMLPMIGAEVCVDEKAQKTQHPGWLKDWQKTECLAMNVACNGIRWVADLMCRSVPIKDPSGVLPRWAFWVYSNLKVIQFALAGKDRTVMTCEETRPELDWECTCSRHSTNAYVTKHQVYLPWHILVDVFTHLKKHQDELKAEMLQLEALVAMQLKQELKRKAEVQEKVEQAKKPKVEEPAVKARPAPSASAMPPLILTEEALRRISEMVTQNLMQAMPMFAAMGQHTPAVAPTLAPVVGQDSALADPTGSVATRKDELEEMQVKAREGRENVLSEAMKKADEPKVDEKSVEKKADDKPGDAK